MRALITFAFLLLTVTVVAQLNDATAFLSGNYDKSFIQKHKIKQIIINGYLNKRQSNKFVFDFNKQGLLLKYTSLDSGDKKGSEFTFIYNSNGDQIERKEISYSLNKSYSTTFEKGYNGTLLVSEKSSELPFVTNHSYNNKGQKILSVTILGNESNANKKNLRYTYDNKGRLMSCDESLTDGNSSTSIITGNTIYQYDSFGNLITVVKTNSTAIGKGQMIYKLKYNQNGLLVSSTSKMPEDLGGMTIVDNYSYTFWK